VFVGSGTVPGVGVPIVLLSGRLAADRVEQTSRR
jgi:phytoene desaturase